MFKRFVKEIFYCLSIIFAIFIFNSSKIEASYKYCDTKIANTDYYDCGYYIYTYYEDVMHSSMIYSLDKDTSIIYIGEKDNSSVFLARGFRYFNRSYDDRSSANNNLWSVVTNRGVIVFDGSFDDSWLVDETNEGYYQYRLYADVYTIRQYVNNGKLYRTIVIYNVYDDSIDFTNSYYDSNELISDEVNEVLESKEEIKINLESIYGVKRVITKIGGVEVSNTLDMGIIYIDRNLINSKLVRGEVVNLEVIAYDYFNNKEAITYKLLLLNNIASIKFETMTSLIETTSRRIVISASAGKGKQLDKDYCWYYWSTSPDDSLLYDDFLMNYSRSDYKGSYSEDKGVILRNTSGTYYLYALARDDDSYIVVKSEGYALNDTGYKVNYDINDAILIVSLLLVCVLPISIYLYIRKKEY